MEQPVNNDSLATTKRILVFNKMFVALSETFIFRQIQALSYDFKVDLMGYTLINSEYFNLSEFTFLRLNREMSILERGIKFLCRKIIHYHFNYKWSTWLSLQKYLKQSNVVVHAHYGWNGVFLYPILKKYKIPLVVSFHGNDASGKLNNQDYKSKLPSLSDYASKIILCSSHMIETLKLEMYMDKVRIIPYGIDINEFKPIFNHNENAVIKILHVGRLVAKKGVPDLIKVFAKLKNIHAHIELQIVGDGDEFNTCHQTIEELSLKDSVTMYGAQSQHKVKDLMAKCDIFVLNSRIAPDGDMEGLPNALLEAMAFAKAVVSTNHAGIPMAIDHTKNGVLVSECNNEALEAAIESLILDKELRDKLGTNARIKIEESFTIDKMNVALQEVFNEINFE